METYSFLRELADSWGLLAMTALFIGICLFAFRPGSRPAQDDAANSIFRNDDKHPAQAAPSNRPNLNRKEA